jgi:signal transduction histidine kinase
MDDIIWAVNPANDKFQNLGLRIREYAIPLFESKNIKFQIHFSEQLSMLPLPMDIRRNVYLIAKEAVNNLVKYSECEEAEIEFNEQNNLLLMTICDNGKGFDPIAPSSRNGLRNMRRRADQIKSILEITSEPGKGASIRLRVGIN